MEDKMNLDELTLGQIKQLQNSISGQKQSSTHPMLGRRCLIRTYSAGVHIGDVTWINPENSMEIKLENALRLWKWEGGGLSLSAVANNGIKGGRLNKTGEVALSNVIEFIPTSTEAEKTYVKFIEDTK
jgi:hypothetical protein